MSGKATGTQRGIAEKSGYRHAAYRRYTLEGKARGTTQVFEAYSKLLGMNNTLRWIRCCPRQSLADYAAWSARSTDAEKAGAFGVDVRRDDAPLRKVAGIPGEFESCAKTILSAVNGHLCM